MKLAPLFIFVIFGAGFCNGKNTKHKESSKCPAGSNPFMRTCYHAMGFSSWNQSLHGVFSNNPALSFKMKENPTQFKIPDRHKKDPNPKPHHSSDKKPSKKSNYIMRSFRRKSKKHKIRPYYMVPNSGHDSPHNNDRVLFYTTVNYVKQGPNSVVCSAVSASPKVLVTAASCIKRKRIKHLYVTFFEVQYFSRITFQEKHYLNRYIIHPQYDEVLNVNNIAMLLLSSMPLLKIPDISFKATDLNYESRKVKKFVQKWVYSPKEVSFYPIFKEVEACEDPDYPSSDEFVCCKPKNKRRFRLNRNDIGLPLLIFDKFRHQLVFYGLYTGLDEQNTESKNHLFEYKTEWLPWIFGNDYYDYY